MFDKTDPRLKRKKENKKEQSEIKDLGFVWGPVSILLTCNFSIKFSHFKPCVSHLRIVVVFERLLVWIFVDVSKRSCFQRDVPVDDK